MNTPKRTDILRRFNSMWTERSSWDAHIRDIASYNFPRASRFQTSDTNRGEKKHNLIHDNTPLWAHRTLAAGMMSGMTSPARPWFRLGLQDKELLDYTPVKQWLHDVTEKMRTVFSVSNTYNALHQCYEELGAFGTWANFVRPNFQRVIHHYPMTFGEYAIATNDEGSVDTLARKLSMTVGQMAKGFPRENLSTAVRNMIDRGSLDGRVDVMHYIAPRSDYDRTKGDGKNMPFASCYFEAGSNEDKLLGESGFKQFPGLCPRWVVTGNDVYGRSPGMDCLGDVKQLQLMQLRKLQAIDYQVNPPLQVPSQFKDQADKRLPGGIMYVDAASAQGGIRTAFDVNLRLDFLLEDIRDTRERVRSAYYADLFLMLANDSRTGRTATEIAERHEEKLLMLGPVLERLQNELLAPLVNMTFDRLADAGALPKPPKELEGVDLNIEFVSTLAQAQRAVSSAGADRLLTTVGSLAQLSPTIVDKIDFDQVVDDYAEMYGVNPKLVVSDEVVAERRAARAQAEQEAATAAAAPQMVDSMKTAGEINPSGVANVADMFSGYTASNQGE
jgi:Bacteriophage head to tail connecting protein